MTEAVHRDVDDCLANIKALGHISVLALSKTH